MLTTLKKHLPDESTMLAMGGLIAHAMGGNTALIFLQGELGAGKTSLVRGFLRAMGYAGRVKSPTYTLVESYQIGGQTVYHFDFYRIGKAAELEFIGIHDYLTDAAICLVEWPELAENLLPTPDLVLQVEVQPCGRMLEIAAKSKRGQEIMERFRNAANAL